MALILGTSTVAPRTKTLGGSLSLASYGQEDAATLASASARLASLGSKPAPGPENGSETEKVDVKEEKKPKLAMPAPKEETDGAAFLAVLDTIGEAKEEPVKEEKVEPNDMFMIDKTGEEIKEVEEPAAAPPVRQLKRRNAAMYSTNE
jgi:hypothetical protein